MGIRDEAEMVDRGRKIIFEKRRGADVSWAERKMGSITTFVRRGRVYELDWEVHVKSNVASLEAARYRDGC